MTLLGSQHDQVAVWDWLKWLPHIDVPGGLDGVGPARYLTSSPDALAALLGPTLSTRPLFDGIQLADAPQHLYRDRMAAGRMEVEELSSAMRQTGEFSHALPEGLFVSSIVIDHQMAAPLLKKVACMHAAATRLVVEDDDPWRAFEIVAAVGPHIGPFGLALAGLELLHGCLIGMQYLALQEQFGQPIDHGLQAHAQLTDPLRQRRAGNRHTVAFTDLFDAIQGQMIEIFLDQDPGMKPWGSQSAVDDRGRHRRGGDGFAAAAGILRADVANHKEAGRFNVELFADVLADLDQIRLALPAGAGFRFMPNLDAFQMVGEWLATGANTQSTRFGFRYRRFQFGFDRRQILIGVVFEQALLLGSECFALDAETQTFQVGQFEGEFLDFEFFGLQLCLVRRSLIHHVLCLRQEGGIKVQFGEFGEQIHGMDYTTQPH